MPTLSSHVLDSVHGTHAAGLRVEASIVSSSDKESLFSLRTDENGRFNVTIDIPDADSLDIEIIFHTRDYFNRCTKTDSVVRHDEFKLGAPTGTARPAVNVVVVRMTLSSSVDSYHAPMVLSPHSYTLWWS